MLLLLSGNRKIATVGVSRGDVTIKDQEDKTFRKMALTPLGDSVFAQPYVAFLPPLSYKAEQRMDSHSTWQVSDVIAAGNAVKLLISVEQAPASGQIAATQIILRVAGDNGLFFPLQTLAIKSDGGIITSTASVLAPTQVVELPGVFKMVIEHKTSNGTASILWGLV